MHPIRETAKDILKVIGEREEIRSSGDTAKKWDQLVPDTPHDDMLANWRAGGIKTACNGFVGWYSATLAARLKKPHVNFGLFPLREHVTKLGMKHAWVKSTPDVQPEYGDVCRHTAFHVGVSLDFDGKHWRHVDAGQGGPKKDKTGKLDEARSFDILKRTRGDSEYDYKKLEGWVDIVVFFSTSQQTAPVPDWLLGWWTVTWRGTDYYYWFDRDRNVQWTQYRPTDTIGRPVTAVSDTGNFAIDGNTVTIRWTTGSIETLDKASVAEPAAQMSGKWNDTEPLTATRMS